MKKSTLSGFSLVEMCVVLVIMGLMLAGMLLPMQAQLEHRQYQQTRTGLIEIREALMGFAIIHGRLPCPSTVTDPLDVNFGVEALSCTTATAEGYLPWKTLGVAETDAWGSPQQNATGGMKGYWRYRLDMPLAETVFDFSLKDSANPLKIMNSMGSKITTGAGAPVAIVYSTGKNLRPDGENADYEPTGGVYQSDVQSTGFDDVMVWFARPLLVNRMVSAGKLP